MEKTEKAFCPLVSTGLWKMCAYVPLPELYIQIKPVKCIGKLSLGYS
jgi:hypothetical protein